MEHEQPRDEQKSLPDQVKMLPLVIDKRIPSMLENKEAMRISIFLRKKSPYYDFSWDKVVAQTCSTLGIDPTASRAKLMVVWKWDRLTIFAFDVWHDAYDWSIAHHRLSDEDDGLPVILVDYSKRLTNVQVAEHDFRRKVHRHVANQHENHGWNVQPPYFQDQTASGVPTYSNPRSGTTVCKDGVVRRTVKTPPPGSVSVYLLPPQKENSI